MSLFEGFVHPAIAWGALLAAVPLLIHIFNRQRHKPMPWAAMRFVLEAYRKTRRRAQLENLLLLFLRMAAVALLALAVARPFTGRESALGPLTESRRDVVLILDGSASTGYRERVQSVFEVELERAREILGELDGTRGDRVRLVLAAAQPRLLSARSPEDALALLPTLTQPTDERLDLGAVLADVARFAEEEASGAGWSDVEVRLLTDLQRTSFVNDAPETRDDEADTGGTGDATKGAGDAGTRASATLTRALDRLDDLGLRVIVEDVGPPVPFPVNLSVESVEPVSEVLGSGLPIDIGVTVRNHGTAGRSAVRVVLAVDGERLPSEQVDVPGRGSAQVVYPVVFREGGHHALEARLEGDALAVDDVRAHVVHVPRPLRVLLVDGDPSDEIDRSEVGYLRVVLEPSDDDGLVGGTYAPFETHVVAATAFGGADMDLSDYDVVVLANVGLLSAGTVEELESHVAAGGGLVFTMGERLAETSAIEGANARLWRSDGSGLLPARLRRVVEVPSRRDRYYRAAWFQEDHPALRHFADDRWRPFLTEAPIYAFMAVAAPDEPAAGTDPQPGERAAEGAAGVTRVLAYLDDADRSPLLLERAYDRGRVLFWTTSIDADWTRLPESPASLVPLVHELLRYAGRGVEPARNIPVGAGLVAEVASFPRGPMLVAPDGARRPLDGEPLAITEGLWRLPPVDRVDTAGTWRIEMDGAPDYPFAVELDPAEGDLASLDPTELENLHPVWRAYEPSADGDVAGEESRPERGELWRWFAVLALTALVLETLWAAWIGHMRRRV